MKLNILRLPSSPKGEIVGIMILVWLYVTDVVLDGNTLKWQCSDQGLKMLEIKKYAGEWFKRCVPAGTSARKCVHTRRSPVHEVRTPSSLF